MLTLKLYADRPTAAATGKPFNVSNSMCGPNPFGKTKLELAEGWLRQHVPVGVQLEAGPLIRQATLAGHRRATLALARWRLGIVSYRSQGTVNPPWIWRR
jgi:hypothetical protein